jgi:hypothetical protein
MSHSPDPEATKHDRLGAESHGLPPKRHSVQTSQALRREKNDLRTLKTSAPPRMPESYMIVSSGTQSASALFEPNREHALSPTASTMAGNWSRDPTAPSIYCNNPIQKGVLHGRVGTRRIIPTWRPAWLLTTIPSQPYSTALSASSTHWIPLRRKGRPPLI